MISRFLLNDREVAWEVQPATSLRDELRAHGILSVRNACDGEGSCGLCAVLFDGRLVNSCQVLAVQAEGHRLWTVEAFAKNRELDLVQRALVDAAAVQCGYCTPAVTLAIHELLSRDPDPDREAIQDALSSTMCRCTGYEQFYTAVRLAARRKADPAYQEHAIPEFKPELRHVGKDREKIDAAPLARGERAFVEDFAESDACHLAVLGSPYAHAWVKKVDASAALAMPGVVAVLCKDNCPDQVYTTAGQGFPEASPYDQRMFPLKVRHVGDRVAAVLAESLAEARAALAAIKVEYEILPPILSLSQAQEAEAPLVHAGEITYLAGSDASGQSKIAALDSREEPIIYQFPLGSDPHRNLAASASGGIGDIDRGFAEAEVSLERDYVCNRVQCTPMEPHIVYARVTGGRLILHASTQVPWHVRRITAKAIGIAENKVRVIKERVGGGFGAKQDIVVEDIAGYLAWTTGKPVLFRYTREEEFIASRTRHPMRITVKLGARRNGKLTAIDMNLRADTGPYGQHSLTVPMNAISKSLPLLLCDNAHYEVRSYYTNLSPAGAYQGYGAPQGSFALQTALAELAEQLGMDQLDLIELNRVRSGARLEVLKSLGEGREGAAVTLGECGLGEMIARGRIAFDWPEGSKPRKEEAKVAAELGPDWRLGRGAVIIQQGSGLPGLDAANAELRLLTDGTLLMLSGGADLGTGLDTITAKTAAELLGLEMEDVAVVSGDTDMTPFDKGAYASSGTFFSGGAALAAAKDLRDKVLARAAEILGEKASDIRIETRGRLIGKKGQTSLEAIALASAQGSGGGELVGFGSFKTEHAAFPYGAHFVEAAVNLHTGETVLRRYHVYQDCGTPINPALTLGQIYGGVMKAVGHSLYEEMLYDQSGRCLNPRFLDYKIPSIREVPEDFHVELLPVEDEVGPFGGKSVSEISLNGAAAAISIAIHDATGAWLREWPFTPERILRAMGKLG